MKTQNIAIYAWVAITVAIAAWVGVFIYAGWISRQLDTHQSQATDMQSISEREMEAIRLHALVRDTKNLRAQLDGLTRTDVIGVANIIESIGKIVGAKVKIGAATPEAIEQKGSSNNTSGLRAVSFVVESEGTFASLMNTAALLETLPMISSIQGMEIERAPLSSGPNSTKQVMWRLVAHIRVLTSADISS